jgi:aminotransferase
MSASKSARNRVAHHISALPRSGIRDFFELVMAMDDVISLGVGEPDFATPWSIREATIYALDRGHTSYTSNLGLLPLREAICRYVEREFGVGYSAEDECIITVGVSEALDLVLRAILEPGDEVIYHEPCYVSYAPSIAMAHAVPVPVVTRQEHEFELTTAAVAAAITDRTKAILLNFPTNPTGAVLSEQTKHEIAELAVAHDLIVLSDEIYAELTYGERGPSIAACPGMRERTVFLHGFSKAYAMTGYRIGYACGPPDLIDAMMKIHQYSMLCASILGQEAALEALTDSGYRQMTAMRDEYRMRRNLCVRRFAEMGLHCFTPQGAFYIFPNITATGLSAEAFARQLLQEESVAVVPGTAFGEEAGTGHVRCSYATSMDQLETAMDRIGAFVARCQVAAPVAAG